MEAVIHLLRNNSTLTNLLGTPLSGTKADAIYIGHGEQEQAPPYITVEKTLDNAYTVKDQRKSLIKENYSIFIYGRNYAEVESIGTKVENTLDRPTPATYNGQYLDSCVFAGNDIINDIQPNNEYWVKILTFDAMVQDPTNVTELTSFTYSNNNQSKGTSETMDNMVATILPNGATVTFAVISGSLPTNATLNSTTGLITQSAAASEGTYTWTVRVRGYGDYVGEFYVTCSLIVTDTVPAYVLTQAAYDALTPDANTYYLIDNS